MGENYIEFGMSNPEFYDVMFIQKAPMNVLEQMENCNWNHGDAALNALKIFWKIVWIKGFIKKANPWYCSYGDMVGCAMALFHFQ